MIQARVIRLFDWNGPLVTGLAVAAAVGAGLLLAWLPLADAALLLALSVLALLTVAEPLTGVIGGLFLGLLRAYLQAKVPQIPAQIGHLFVALAIAAWIAQALAHRDLRALWPSPTARPLLLALLTWIGAAWLSLWNPADLANYALPEFVKWLEMLFILLLVAARARPRHLPWLAGGVLVVGLFQAAFGLYQFGLRGEGPHHFIIPGSDFYRAYGTFEQPNPFAGTMGMLLALAVGILGGAIVDWMAGRLGDRVTRKLGDGDSPAHLVSLSPCLLVSLLLAAALIASWSRGAWIGFAAALAVMGLALPRRPQWGLLLVAAAALLLLLLYSTGLLPPSLVARLTDFAADLRLQDVRGVGINDANYAVLERLAHWQTAIEMWRAHFWTGVGLGCYEPAYPHFALINWPFALGHAHNLYLTLLAETGLLGTLAYALLWATVFWQTWQATRRSTGLARGTALGLLGAWTQLAVHNLFDNLYVNNVHFIVALLLGLLAVLIRNPQPATCNTQPETCNRKPATQWT